MYFHRDQNGFYLSSSGHKVDLYLDSLAPADAKLIGQPDSEPMLLCRKHGVIENTALVEKKCRVVKFTAIFMDDLLALMNKLSYLDSGFSCVPFLLPTTKLGCQVYRSRFIKDPNVLLPHVLRIEGIITFQP